MTRENDTAVTQSSKDGGGKCAPCESLNKSTLLSLKQVQDEISSKLQLWHIVSTKETEISPGETIKSVNKISRKFTAKNFQCALNAVNDMGKIAEREGHHPDFHITSYRDVEIVILTHKVGGVTKNDLILANIFDEECNFIYSPKWLKNNPKALKE